MGICIPGSTKVSIVYPTCGRPEYLIRSLVALLDNEVLPDKIVIVDQSSGPETKEAVAGLGNQRIVHVASKERGLSRAKNLGIAVSTGCDIIGFIDDDCIPARDWVRSAMEAVARAPKAAIWIGALVPDETALNASPDAREETTVFLHGIPDPWQYNPAGGNSFYRRSVFDTVGMFDTLLGQGSTFAGAEDGDMVYRVLRSSSRVIFTGTIRCLHLQWRGDVGDADNRYNYGRGVGAMLAKHVKQGDCLTMGYVFSRHFLKKFMVVPYYRVLGNRRLYRKNLRYSQGIVSGFRDWRRLHRGPKADEIPSPGPAVQTPADVPSVDPPSPGSGQGAGPPDASVLIPSYNNKRDLLQCIEHFARQSYPFDRFEVVVVLDGSIDGSREALERLQPPFRLRIIAQPNQGRAAALNRAAREAAGEILIVTDADILPNESFVQSHIRALGNADVVIGPIPLSQRSPTNFVTDGVKRWADRHEARMRNRQDGISCSEIYGANLSIRRGHFWNIGGYRTDLRRTEDYQLGKKILVAGYRIVFEPEARAEQLYDKTIPQWCRDFYQDGVSHTRLIREYPEEQSNLRIGRYYPQSRAQHVLRPLVIRRRLVGRGVIAVTTAVLERCRRMGLRWRVLSKFQGLIGDAFFWQGVYDETADRARFEELIRPKEVAR